jgi:hypothetical protein
LRREISKFREREKTYKDKEEKEDTVVFISYRMMKMKMTTNIITKLMKKLQKEHKKRK